MMKHEWVLWASLALVFGVLVAPGAWDGIFNGPPLGWHGRLVLVGLAAIGAWAVVFRAQHGASRRVLLVLVGLILVKLLIGTVDGPTGWRGSYVLVDASPPRVAPFFERLQQRPYRFDRSIDFSGRGFQFHFLNDLIRYNRADIGPNRTEALPIDMAWSTWFDVHRSQTLSVIVEADANVAVFLDHQPLDVVRGQRGWMAHAHVQPREHLLVVAHRKPKDTPAAVRVHVLLDGDPAALRAFAHRPPLGRRAAVISDGSVLTGVALGLYQLWLAFAGGRLQPRLGATVASGVVAWLACLYILWSAFGAAQSVMGSTVDLGAGDDPLAYESNARNIMEEGLLMPLGRPVGQGSPYFFYPLYSYALAGVHWFVGEDYDAVRLFNGMCSAALPLLFWVMGWRKLSFPAQLLGMTALSLLVVRHSGWYWQSALTDNLFIPLAIAAVWLAALSVRSTTAATAAVAGLAAGLAGSTRPSFLLFVGAFAAALLILGRPLPARARMLRSAAFVAAYGMALLPFLLRNYIMSGEAVVVVTLSHAITVALIPPEGGITPPPLTSVPPSWLEAFTAAWQMFKTEPGLLLWLEIRKVLFTLGFTNMGPSVIRLQYEFPVLLALCAAALWQRAVPRPFLIAFTAFFMSHMAAMVIAYPWTYGYKSILPLQYLFLYCGLYLTRTWWQGRARPDHLACAAPG